MRRALTKPLPEVHRLIEKRSCKRLDNNERQSLDVPNNQRLYALSFYEHTKCATARGLPCVDASPPVWAEQTVQGVFSTIGSDSGARVVAYEMGDLTPVQSTWTTSQAIQNLLVLMATYGMDGGSFWRWT